MKNLPIILAVTLFCGCATKQPPPVAGNRVYEVKTVKAEILKSNPPQLAVEATGSTRTGGWTNPRLEARIYIQPPADGIYVFDFVADKPGNSTGAITPISASTKVTAPNWLKGVRVVAETNSKQEKL